MVCFFPDKAWRLAREAEMGQMGLVFPKGAEPCLPTAYTPRAPAGVEIDRIVLTRGSLATAEREGFVRRICGTYPGASVEERQDLAHNRVDLGEADALTLCAKMIAVETVSLSELV